MSQFDFDLESIAHQAFEEFWIFVAKQFPTATSGDLEPLTVLKLHEVAKAVIAEWVYWNVPEYEDNYELLEKAKF